jgi:hypothetical protein
MDYCLDWKPDLESWSAREVVYHLVDTPATGLHTILQGLLSGTMKEFDLVPGLTNMTPERQICDLEHCRQDLQRVLDGIEEAVSQTNDDEITSRSAVVHLKAQGWDEERTIQMLLEGLFTQYWRRHLEHLRKLRETLGV